MRRRLGWVFTPLCFALACGGRFQRGGDGDGDFGGSATSQGGAGSSQAGTPSAAGSSVRGGAPTAGTTSAGGVASMPGGCACGPIACAPGYVAVPVNGDCCFECQPDPMRCEQQQLEYRFYRDAVLFKYAPYKCATSMDCTMYYDQNECQVFTCGTVVDRASLPAIDAELSAFARMNCNPSCMAEVPPCVPEPAPRCGAGACE